MAEETNLNPEPQPSAPPAIPAAAKEIAVVEARSLQQALEQAFGVQREAPKGRIVAEA